MCLLRYKGDGKRRCRAKQESGKEMPKNQSKGRNKETRTKDIRFCRRPPSPCNAVAGPPIISAFFKLSLIFSAAVFPFKPGAVPFAIADVAFFPVASGADGLAGTTTGTGAAAEAVRVIGSTASPVSTLTLFSSMSNLSLVLFMSSTIFSARCIFSAERDCISA